jgi:hypothetical protein
MTTAPVKSSAWFTAYWIVRQGVLVLSHLPELLPVVATYRVVVAVAAAAE